MAGVYFTGPRALAYRACLWSRLANRILWPLAQLDATDGDIFYQGMKGIEWGEVFDSSKTIAIDFSGENRNIRNTQFGAQRSKDAIVDWFVAAGAPRPSVDRANPDVRLNVRLVRDRAHLSIDLSGGSLHQRGYRLQAGVAPSEGEPRSGSIVARRLAGHCRAWWCTHRSYVRFGNLVAGGLP